MTKNLLLLIICLAFISCSGTNRTIKYTIPYIEYETIEESPPIFQEYNLTNNTFLTNEFLTNGFKY